MGNALDLLKEYYAKDRKTWRKWLEKNHTASAGIWLIYYKKDSGKTGVTYAEAVEEALCFGWIDSTQRPRDEESSKQSFMPRKDKSTWSRPNKQRVEKMEQEGLMTDAGRAKIEIAKQNGSWTSLDDVEDLIVPDQLAKAFAKNKTAKKNFDAMSASVKKQFLYLLSSTKVAQTRKKRIAEIIRLTKANLGLYRRENGKSVRNV
jgi:uncharacterized protein YdeI (YjbR/CyaY-like superfamily)